MSPDLSSWNIPRGQATRVACLTWQCDLLIRPNLFYTGGGQHTRWIGIGPHRVGAGEHWAHAVGVPGDRCPDGSEPCRNTSFSGKDGTYSLVIHRAHEQQQKLDGLGGELKPCKLLCELEINLGLGNVV